MSGGAASFKRVLGGSATELLTYGANHIGPTWEWSTIAVPQQQSGVSALLSLQGPETQPDLNDKLLAPLAHGRKRKHVRLFVKFDKDTGTI